MNKTIVGSQAAFSATRQARILVTKQNAGGKLARRTNVDAPNSVDEGTC